MRWLSMVYPILNHSLSFKAPKLNLNAYKNKLPCIVAELIEEIYYQRQPLQLYTRVTAWRGILGGNEGV